MNKKVIYFILAIIAYVAAAGISYVVFSKTPSLTGQQAVISQPLPTTKTLANGSVVFDQNAPKTESCPLNGAMYSKEQKNWWMQHEPLGVMIENHQDARPQSGLSYADIVYEAVAEGGITRFLGVFYCQDASEIGPIRSARVYFLDELSEYGSYPLYAHVGGANADGPADALGTLDKIGWTGYNDLNQFSIGFPTFWRDYDRLGHTVATEHTMYSTTGKLWAVAKTRGITNTVKGGNSWDSNFNTYLFQNDAAIADRPAAQSIHVEFWSGDPAYYDDWTYDSKNNVYKRNNGGIAHIDKDTNQQLTTKNLVYLSMQQTHANDGYEDNVHLLYNNRGTGKAVIFMNGKRIAGTWKKDSRTSRTLVYDSIGNPIKFVQGKIWFSILPLDGVLTVK